jgi:hypothetical protein
MIADRAEGKMGRRCELGALGFGILVAWPEAAAAECLSGCLDGLVSLLVSAAVYVAIGIGLLVMVLRKPWRRAGLWALGGVLAVAVGFPLASQAWQAWQVRAMERREVLGEPPAMTARTPLLIANPDGCIAYACSVVLAGRGAQETYLVPLDAVQALDLTGPVALADLPIEVWTLFAPDAAEPRMRTLSVAERQAAVARIDYVIIVETPYYLSEPGAFEAGLRSNPDFADLSNATLLAFAMAPVPQGGVLSLGELRFDILDLWHGDGAFAVPLAPGNWAAADNSFAGLEAAVRALCPQPGDEVDWFCQRALE